MASPVTTLLLLAWEEGGREGGLFTIEIAEEEAALTSSEAALEAWCLLVLLIRQGLGEGVEEEEELFNHCKEVGR